MIFINVTNLLQGYQKFQEKIKQNKIFYGHLKPKIKPSEATIERSFSYLFTKYLTKTEKWISAKNLLNECTFWIREKANRGHSKNLCQLLGPAVGT